MISARQLGFIQSLGEKWMTTTAVIHHKGEPTLDDSNPYGDDTITLTTSVTVKGWLVPNLNKTVGTMQAQVIGPGQFILRVPVGTHVHPGDKVDIDGRRYGVVDVSDEQSWPEWLKVSLIRSTP